MSAMLPRDKKFSSVGKDLTDEVFAGETYRTNRVINRIVIHCSASPQGRGDNAHTIDKWHLEKGWSGIGYHYVVLEDGTILKGRWVDAIPAHARGYNSDSIAILRIGGMGSQGQDLMDATDEQRHSIRRLCRTLISDKMYGLLPNQILGHNELPNVKKTCPLMNMNLIRNTI